MGALQKYQKPMASMDKVRELMDVLAQPEVVARTAIAKAHHTCKICNRKAICFRTPRAELEYAISTICQTCQDYFFPSATD